MSQTYSVEQLVDEQKFSWFNIKLLFWSFLAMFGDGYDITVMGFAAPVLVREWGVNPQMLGPVLSASLVGILVGAPLLGYFGDRYGRRPAIILGCIIYGTCTLLCVWAENLTQIGILRFLTGIGIGGLMPNAIALNSELSPKRLRATLVILMFTGITMGNAVPGAVSAWLVPTYGWESLFLLGGVAPLFIAACLFFTLPESVKYLALRPEKRAELLATLRRMRPGLTVPEDARFELAAIPPGKSGSTRQLFAGGLGFITPLLWICFSMALMTIFFLNSWMPLLFERGGATPGDAALASSFYHIGAMIGGFFISILLDRFGFLVVAALFALGAIVVASMGIPHLPFTGVIVLLTAAGFFSAGAQFGNNAAAGLIYPTSFRSKGVGWAFAIGRFGSIAGPMVGSVLIGMNLPTNQLFMAPAIPLTVGTIASIILARLCYRRFGSFQLDDKAAVTGASPIKP